MNKKGIWTLIIIILIIIGAIWLIGQMESDETTAETPEVEVSDQVEGQQVFIERVVLSEPGYVVAYNSDGSVAGRSDYREAGEYQNVTVALDEAVQAGQSVEIGIVADDGDQEFNTNSDTRVSYRGRVIAGRITFATEEEAGDDGIVGTDDDASNDDGGATTTDDEALEEEEPADGETTEDETTADEEAVVRYTDTGFEPGTLQIIQGATVRFVNESSNDMWVASDEHPTHTTYSGTTRDEHCPDPEGDNFDQCEVGAEYSFTFYKAGTWAYHNHVGSVDGGTIVVRPAIQ